MHSRLVATGSKPRSRLRRVAIAGALMAAVTPAMAGPAGAVAVSTGASSGVAFKSDYYTCTGPVCLHWHQAYGRAGAIEANKQVKITGDRSWGTDSNTQHFTQLNRNFYGNGILSSSFTLKMRQR
jgi:hypothetical protein